MSVMSDDSIHTRADAPGFSITTGELAQRINGTLHGDADLILRGVNGLLDAAPDELTFIADAAHVRRWAASKARAVIVSRDIDLNRDDAGDRIIIEVDDADLAMIDALQLWAPPIPRPAPGVHPTAWIHPDAAIGAHACIGAHVSIDAHAVLGDHVVVHDGVRISQHVRIGDACTLHCNCVIRERCSIGGRVTLHPGVVVGADGFGYRPSPADSSPLKVPQIGTVEIHDDVEIGANSCIDRGKFGATIIGANTKIDNLCQIAHNCRIGRNCIIAGLTGMAGSVILEDDVMLAGMVGIADHVTVGRGARIAAQAGVMADVPPGKVMFGLPADQLKATMRQTVCLRKLPDHMRRVERMLREQATRPQADGD
jgi:UDP-3-O-[3-hydroxymyristoyl] glucosamine N-acyltransferase